MFHVGNTNPGSLTYVRVRVRLFACFVTAVCRQVKCSVLYCGVILIFERKISIEEL